MTNITCANAVTTVQQDSNLSKNYFNIRGKFFTKDTTFYIYLDNDVYEIPLDKLQVNGSNPANMQAGIDALAALLASAGAGGGNSALPINDLQINLYLNAFVATNYGIYRITGSGDGTWNFSLPDPSGYNGNTIVIQNTDGNPAFLNPLSFPPLLPDGTEITNIPATSIYTIVSYGNDWHVVSIFQI